MKTSHIHCTSSIKFSNANEFGKLSLDEPKEYYCQSLVLGVCVGGGVLTTTHALLT